VDKTGQVLDGSAFVEKKTSVYEAYSIKITEVRNKAGEQSVIITLDNFPMMKIRGSYPDAQGLFYLTSLDYLGGNEHGWNEYSLDIAGTGRLNIAEDFATVAINPEIEAVQISSGRIHRYDTRITGHEALSSLRNRRERVLALSSWITERESAAGGTSAKSFEKKWKPVLFPEMVSKKNRPVNWQQEGDPWVRAEDIRWNTGYTDRTFPEELKQVRNSGTLLRDWEEALSWIYLEYEWENIKNLLSRQIILQKKK